MKCGQNKNQIYTTYLRVFLAAKPSYINKTKCRKLDERAEQSKAYQQAMKDYRIYTKNRRIILARTVKFIENKISNSNDRTEENLNLHKKVQIKMNTHSQITTIDLRQILHPLKMNQMHPNNQN